MDFTYKALLNYRLGEAITDSEYTTNSHLARWHTISESKSQFGIYKQHIIGKNKLKSLLPKFKHVISNCKIYLRRRARVCCRTTRVWLSTHLQGLIGSELQVWSPVLCKWWYCSPFIWDQFRGSWSSLILTHIVSDQAALLNLHQDIMQGAMKVMSKYVLISTFTTKWV